MIIVFPEVFLDVSSWYESNTILHGVIVADAIMAINIHYPFYHIQSTCIFCRVMDIQQRTLTLQIFFNMQALFVFYSNSQNTPNRDQGHHEDAH